MNKKIAIIGVGNKLMGDEGVGIHAIERLREMSPLSFLRKQESQEHPGDSRVRGNDKTHVPFFDILDGGVGGMQIMHLLEKYEHAVIIDAANFGGNAGDVRSFNLNDVNLTQDSGQVSLHGTSLAGILSFAKMLDKKMPEVIIIAVQPKKISASLMLSDECAHALTKIDGELDKILESLL